MSWKLIKALGKIGKVDTALNVFEALQHRDWQEYTEMCCVYFRQGPSHFDQGVAFLDRMRTDDVHPPCLTYVRVIHQLCKTGQSARVSDMLARMEEDKRPSDDNYSKYREQCYSKLVVAFAEESNPQGALGAIQEKEEAGFTLSTIDFCHVIAGFGTKGEWSMVLELLRTMFETGPAPDAEVGCHGVLKWQGDKVLRVEKNTCWMSDTSHLFTRPTSTISTTTTHAHTNLT
eukprot:8243852-Pyramimonas_sp.AAC.1